MLRRSISGTVQYTSRSGRVDATCDTLEITCQSAVLVVSAQMRAHRQQNMKAAKSPTSESRQRSPDQQYREPTLPASQAFDTAGKTETAR
jgi:hypothetical protein